MELHYKCMKHARGHQTHPKQSHGMLKQHQRPAEMETKQARKTCYFKKHTRLVCVIYTTSVLNMHGVTKPIKKSGMPQQNNPKYMLRTSQHKLNKHAQT